MTVTNQEVQVATGPREGAIGERFLPDGRVIVLYPMIFTYRICIGDDGETYDKAWCYPPAHLDKAMQALAEWDGEGDPTVGWIKEVGTGRRRLNGDPATEYVAP